VVCDGYFQLQHLPVEMLEMILLKCCMWRVLDQWEATSYVPSGDMYREFATVWSEWWFRMTRNWFIITLKKRLNTLSMLALSYCLYCLNLHVYMGPHYNTIYNMICAQKLLGGPTYLAHRMWPVESHKYQ